MIVSPLAFAVSIWELSELNLFGTFEFLFALMDVMVLNCIYTMVSKMIDISGSISSGSYAGNR